MAAIGSRSSSRKSDGRQPARESKQPRLARGKGSRTEGGKATVTGDIPSALAELLALGDLGWVVSCYQKLEPGDRAGDKFRIKLKNRIRIAEERLGILGFSHDDREMLTEALARVEDFFHHSSNLSGSRGIGVFAGQGWMRAVRLPHVLRSRVEPATMPRQNRRPGGHPGRRKVESGMSVVERSGRPVARC